MGVEWGQLQLQTFSESVGSDYQLTMETSGLVLTQQTASPDAFEIKVQYDPFRIQQWSGGQLLVEVNSQDTLFFESGTEQIDQSISMGFFINAQNLYGIPARAATFRLNYTNNETDPSQPSNPYRLWNQDMFNHPWGSTWPLYGAIPYILGQAASQTASIAWINSAETFVDLFPYVNSQTVGSGSHVSFTSEGGFMEIFVFGSN